MSGGCRVASVSVEWVCGCWLLCGELACSGGGGGETRGAGDGRRIVLRGSHWWCDRYMLGLRGGVGGVRGGCLYVWRCLDECIRGARVYGVCRDMSEGVEVMGVGGGVGMVLVCERCYCSVCGGGG